MACPVFPLNCVIQNHAWGKLGKEAAVAELGIGGGHLSIVDDKPYAEFWMGCHPSSPSRTTEGKLLSDWLHENRPQDSQLNFVFKVLSVRNALSVQVHPNKVEAAKLHTNRPDLYPDANNKPEMTIAVTPFEMLAYFRSAKNIAEFCRRYRPLGNLLGEDSVTSLERSTDTESALKNAYANLLHASDDLIKSSLIQLTGEVTQPGHVQTPEEDLFLRLNKQHPGDVGCFNPFFLNHITLKPGEAAYMEPNMLHVYVSGDCIECMPFSNNVIRAGLTTKLKDVDTVLTHVNFALQVEQASTKLVHPVRKTVGSNNSFVFEFIPPTPGYKVVQFEAKQSDVHGGRLELGPFHSHAIFIILDGFGEINLGNDTSSVKPGSVYFMAAESRLMLQAKDSLRGFVGVGGDE